MLALVASLIALGLPQNAGSNPAGAEITTAEIAEVLAEAERALERATAAQDAGDPATARAEADRVVELLAPLPLGEGHDETASILWRVWYVAYGTGNLAGAREALERVLDHRERTLHADHPDLLAARGNLAATMYAMGDVPGARALFEVLLEAFERTLPPDHPDLLRARAALASTTRDMGDLAGARVLQEAVLEACERTMPAEHRDLLRARNDLAGTLYAMRDLAGARAHFEAVLEVYERTLPADHPERLAARGNLAATMEAMGDLPGARAHFEAVLEALERTMPADHPELLRARENLAVTLNAMGDLPGARAQFEAVLSGFERTLPADHPDLLLVRGNLAGTMREMGDLAGARAHSEAVLEACERSLPEDHPALLRARQGLAATLKVMGELHRARTLEESVLRAREGTLPADHLDLLRSRENLAGTLFMIGDLLSARALFEAVLEVYERVLPADHPDVLHAQQNLAATMKEMGDLRGSRARLEAVLEAYERTLPADHPDILRARASLAAAMKSMGDLGGARALEEAVLEAYERTLSADHPEILRVRGSLAGTMRVMGDLAAARAMQEAVLEALERTLPADHPDLIRSRNRLAVTMLEMGEFTEARALSEGVLEALERTLPADHPELLAARGGLSVTLRAMGDLPGARAVGIDLARGMLRRLELLSVLSPRETREAVGAEARWHSIVRYLTEPEGEEDADSVRFDLAETLRSLASSSGSSAASDHPGRRAIAGLRARLNDLVSAGPSGAQSLEAFAAEISALSFERDRLERALRDELAAASDLPGTIRAPDVAGALPDGAAAVGFLRTMTWAHGPQNPRLQPAGDVLAAHVLRADGSLVEIVLGPAEELEKLARAWRESIGVTVARLERGSPGERIPRGVGIEAGEMVGGEGFDGGREAGRALRARVLDPVLEAAGEGATTLYVCLDEFMHLVPIDALPLGDGRVGDRYQIVNEVSFARLLTERTPPTGESSLLAVGGVQFDAEIRSEKRSPTALIEAGAERADRSARPDTFEPLLQTRLEVESVLALFEDERGDGAVLLTKAKATKAAFHAHAPGKRFLHVATHGWFAPETISSTLDARDDDALWSAMGVQEAVTGLAPMTLCGLAFAGANQGRDSLGRVPGILTAEELAGIDLSGCELAVLSACETNVGIRRAGQGIQSLQTALHAAGARTAITSLWKVDDSWTRELMTEFYRLIWVEEKPKAEALWEAKMAIRERGAGLVDWAGWVLTGDPD